MIRKGTIKIPKAKYVWYTVYFWVLCIILNAPFIQMSIEFKGVKSTIMPYTLLLAFLICLYGMSITVLQLIDKK